MYKTYIQNNILKVLCFISIFILFITFLSYLSSDNLQLEQVVIISRHNVRVPTSLSQVSPKSCPVWEEPSKYLTKKGYLLESYMGIYFATWLRMQSLIEQDCPKTDTFFIYADTKQRTLASARAFVKHAFPNCNVTIHHGQKPDTIFSSTIHNTSEAFLKEATEIMNRNINEIHAKDSLLQLQDILDYKNSENCIQKHQCDLVNDKNEPYIEGGKKPDTIGPLKVANQALTAFLMEYYQGFSLDNVAWGLIKTKKQWETLTDIQNDYHRVRFNSFLAKDVGRPMLKYIYDIFNENPSKVSVLMGHDTDLMIILNALLIEPFTLKDQFGITPPGGKIVFQKWLNGKGDAFLKVQFIYQSAIGMRNGDKLSLDNTPLSVVLKLAGCKVDGQGFCLWADFMKLLKSLL